MPRWFAYILLLLACLSTLLSCLLHAAGGQNPERTMAAQIAFAGVGIVIIILIRRSLGGPPLYVAYLFGALGTLAGFLGLFGFVAWLSVHL